MNFDHIILTRFNVKISWAGQIKADADWLKHRFLLFDKYCFPSMRSQTNKNFRWLVLFDTDTPDFYKEKITDYAKWECFIPQYIKKFDTQTYRTCVKSLLNRNVTGIVTTRLDNDDAVGIHFVDEIQKHFQYQKFMYLNFPNGYLLRENTLYQVKKRTNAFISLFENSDNFITAWYGNHMEANNRGMVQNVHTTPLWIQVIHEYNIKNTVGRAHKIVPITELSGRFVVSN